MKSSRAVALGELQRQKEGYAREAFTPKIEECFSA